MPEPKNIFHNGTFVAMKKVFQKNTKFRIKRLIGKAKNG